MPISRRQFELGIDDALEAWMTKLAEFLDQNKGAAFTFDELAETLQMSRAEFQEWEQAKAALDMLVHVRAASERQVRSEMYYAHGPFALSEILEPR